jgi:ATP/maltotriose-dependent transcriptional regulator MalT
MNPSVRRKQNRLTRREKEVLHVVAEGLTNEQIAERLCLSSHTVRAHLYSIYCKLGVGTRWAAVLRAQQQGIFERELGELAS